MGDIHLRENEMLVSYDVKSLFTCIPVEESLGICEHKLEAWMKREKDGLFDVTMGSYDGAEVCELVGAYLSRLTRKGCLWHF